MPALQTRRVVVVTRPSEFEGLLARHATRGQARFFLESRGGSLEEVEDRHRVLEVCRQELMGAIPDDWRRAQVSREDLDRFLFEPDDWICVLGQDGLVANVAKYLEGQPVFGFDPEPGRNAGVLVRHAPGAAPDLFADLDVARAPLEERTMVEARLSSGERLIALNEIFVGHRSHQSARYRIQVDEGSERQSSSGLIVATGTGSTGWASSIRRERRESPSLPRPADPELAWFVREAWSSVSTGVSLTSGLLEHGESLRLVSEMETGVAFGDGIEADYLALPWGQPIEVRRAAEVLRLVA